MTLRLLVADRERKWSTNAIAFSLHTNFIFLFQDTQRSDRIFITHLDFGNEVGFELIGRIFFVNRSIVSHSVGIIHFLCWRDHVWPQKFRSQWKSIVWNVAIRRGSISIGGSAEMEMCFVDFRLSEATLTTQHKRIQLYMIACGWMCFHYVFGIVNAISFGAKWMNGRTAVCVALVSSVLCSLFGRLATIKRSSLFHFVTRCNASSTQNELELHIGQNRLHIPFGLFGLLLVRSKAMQKKLCTSTDVFTKFVG